MFKIIIKVVIYFAIITFFVYVIKTGIVTGNLLLFFSGMAIAITFVVTLFLIIKTENEIRYWRSLNNKIAYGYTANQAKILIENGAKIRHVSWPEGAFMKCTDEPFRNAGVYSYYHTTKHHVVLFYDEIWSLLQNGWEEV